MKTITTSTLLAAFTILISSIINNVAAQNLLTNPEFTDGTTGWSTDCSMEIYTENVYGGVSSTNNVTEIDAERCFNQQADVTAGASYSFGYKASRRQSGTPATVGVNVTITGVQSGTEYINTNRTYTNTTWSYTNEVFSFTLPLESTDTKVNVKFSNYVTVGTYGTIIDDINLSGGSSMILPIKFTGFNGKIKNNAAVLNWNASNDDNDGKYFIVERSVNQGSFDSIATVKVNGTATSYSYNDVNVSNGSNLYRIKAVNANGFTSYTNVINLDNNTASEIKLYPNPATSKIGLTINTTSNSTASVQIYNIAGNIIMTKHVNLNEGTNAVSIDVTSLKAGSFFLKVADNKGLNISKSFCKK